MLPVVSGIDGTKRQIFLYSFALVAATMALAFLSDAGLFYLASAAGAGSRFHVLRRKAQALRSALRDAAGLFRYSILYLALLFGAIALMCFSGREASDDLPRIGYLIIRAKSDRERSHPGDYETTRRDQCRRLLHLLLIVLLLTGCQAHTHKTRSTRAARSLAKQRNLSYLELM